MSKSLTRLEMEKFWRTGIPSAKQIAFLRELVKAAAFNAMFGMPWSWEDELIQFRSYRQGGTLLIFYGWRYPPREFWMAESSAEVECRKCYPEGPRGNIGREVWCSKEGFSYDYCPYGVRVGLRPKYVA